MKVKITYTETEKKQADKLASLYLEQLQIPEVKGSVPQTCHPPHFRSR